MDRPLIRWLLIIFSIVLAALWLITQLLGNPLPGWVPPCSVLALGVAVAL